MSPVRSSKISSSSFFPCPLLFVFCTSFLVLRLLYFVIRISSFVFCTSPSHLTNSLLNQSANLSSFSTAINFLTRDKIKRVKLPFPGPTSTTTSSSFKSISPTILSKIIGSLRKFCPKTFLARMVIVEF